MNQNQATKSRQSRLAPLPQMVTTRPHSTATLQKKSVPSLVASRPSSVPSTLHLIPIKTRTPEKRGKSVQMWLNTPARRKQASANLSPEPLPELDKRAAQERKRLKYLWQAASPMTRREQKYKLYNTGRFNLVLTCDCKRDAMRVPLVCSSW